VNKKVSKTKFKILDPTNIGFASIDAGTKYTGVTLWHGIRHVETVLLTNTSTSRSLIPIHSARGILKYLTGKMTLGFILDLVILEDFAYNQGGHFNTDQAEIAGIIKHHCFVKNINYSTIPPNTVKMHVTGNGRAGKTAVSKELKTKGFLYKTSHEYDSIGIGMTYLKIWNIATEAMYRRSIIH
jgi:Holliday junction resolvasome RuvABC endonuclease subunit